MPDFSSQTPYGPCHMTVMLREAGLKVRGHFDEPIILNRIACLVEVQCDGSLNGTQWHISLNVQRVAPGRSGSLRPSENVMDILRREIVGPVQDSLDANLQEIQNLTKDMQLGAIREAKDAAHRAILALNKAMDCLDTARSDVHTRGLLPMADIEFATRTAAYAVEIHRQVAAIVNPYAGRKGLFKIPLEAKDAGKS